jgi:tetratricopeptide (TPR) repeat protein
MESESGLVCPEGAIAVTRAGEQEWMFEYPRLSWEILEEFHEAIDAWRVGEFASAEEVYRQLIADYPEFIDACHHLALLLSDTGREAEAFQMWQETVAIGLDCLPEQFEIGRDLLPWYFLENRPFLRAYHGLGLEYLERGEIDEALEISNNMLAMNPNDNQGVRALVIDCNFFLNRPSDVLAVCDQYPGDGLEQVMYGRALALYQLGRRAEAEKALSEAIEFLPLVAKELVKSRHRKPKDLHPDRVTVGGADQAYWYWIDQGQHWKNTPGAIEFVRECLEIIV